MADAAADAWSWLPWAAPPPPPPPPPSALGDWSNLAIFVILLVVFHYFVIRKIYADKEREIRVLFAAKEREISGLYEQLETYRRQLASKG